MNTSVDRVTPILLIFAVGCGATHSVDSGSSNSHEAGTEPADASTEQIDDASQNPDDSSAPPIGTSIDSDTGIHPADSSIAVPTRAGRVNFYSQTIDRGMGTPGADL